MLPKPEHWLARAKKYEPAKLVRNIGALLRVFSALGWVDYSLPNIGILEAQLTILAPSLFSLFCGVADWALHVWLRSKVSSPETSETLANAVLQARNLDARPPVKAVEAAERVLAP